MEHRLRDTYFIADNLISSLGFTTGENMQAIVDGRSGVQLHTDGVVSDASIQAGRICQERLMEQATAFQLESYSRLEQIAILSIKETLEQAPIDRNRCALILSTTKGNVDLLTPQAETIPERAFLFDTATRITDYFGIPARPRVVSNACISGLSALIIADRLLQGDDYDDILVVGVDILSHFITAGFRSFRSLSESLCRPYDAKRDGLNLGEACGTVLLSNKKAIDAPVFLGGAISNDANHISGPSRTGEGLFFSIQGAMREAGISPDEIDFINLHGTATVYNDEMESKAIALSGLSDVPVNSLKPYFGHTLGASGIIEIIACLYQLRNCLVFGTPGFEQPGTSQHLDVSSIHRTIPRSEICLKTASGFGGCNAAILVSLSERNRRHIPPADTEEVLRCRIENSTVCLNGQSVFQSGTEEFSLFIREAWKALGESNPKFYKMDDLSKLGYTAAGYLLKDRAVVARKTGIVLANRSSSLDTDLHFRSLIEKYDAAASPAVFVYTLPNIVAGEICIRHKIQGENTFFIDSSFDEEELHRYAEIAMQRNELQYCLYGWCEYLNNHYQADLRLIKKIN